METKREEIKRLCKKYKFKCENYFNDGIKIIKTPTVEEYVIYINQHDFSLHHFNYNKKKGCQKGGYHFEGNFLYLSEKGGVFDFINKHKSIYKRCKVKTKQKSVQAM